MPCDEVVNCERQDCGAEAVTECYFCGPLCRNHKDEPCSGAPVHVGSIHEEEITQGAACAKEFIRQQKTERLDWEYYNTFLGRRVLRHKITGEFKIIGGQVVVTL